MQTDDPAPKPKPGRGQEAVARETERKRRLAAALRENLKRRKAPRTDRDPPKAE